MSVLQRQVRAASRRLTINVLFDRLALGAVVAAGGWGLLVLFERTFVFGLPLWTSFWIACGLGALVALVGTVLSRVGALQAAVAIDRAAGLKERVSTALAVQGDSDPFAHAAVRDAEKAAANLHVPQHIPLRAPRLLPWTAATVCSTFLLYFLMPQLNLLAGEKKPEVESRKEQTQQAQAVRKQVTEQLARVRKLAEENPKLAEAARGLEALKVPENATRTPEDLRREAMKQLSNVQEQLRRQQDSEKLDALKEMKRQLARLEAMQGKEPESELSKALASGDMSAAKKALNDLQKKLDEVAKSSDPAAKQQLAEMQQKLAKLAEQLPKELDTRQLEKELQNKGGLSEEQAKKLMEKLAQMNPDELKKELQKQLEKSGMSQQQIEQLAKKVEQQKQACQQCQGLAQALQKAAQCMKQGDGQQGGQGNLGEAQAALSEAGDQLTELEMAEQEMNALEAALREIQEAKDGVCQGDCKGQGDIPGDIIGQQGRGEGLGYGHKIGKQKAAGQYRPEKAKVRLQSGEIIGQVLIDGPQMKGEAAAEAREVVSAAIRDAEGAIDRQSVPRQYETVLKTYFDRLAGLEAARLKNAQQASEEKPSGDDGDK